MAAQEREIIQQRHNRRYPTIGVRVSRPTYDIIKAEADKAGLDVATFVRRALASTLSDSTGISAEDLAAMGRVQT